MNITTIVFFAVIAFFMWRGYQNGFAGAVIRILSWLLAYPAAIFLTKPFAILLTQYTALDGLMVYLAAGCIIFLVTSLIVSFVLGSIARSIPENQFTENGSKIGGSVVGIIVGGVLGLLVVYLIDAIKKPVINPAAHAQQLDNNSAETEPSAKTSIHSTPITNESPAIENQDSFIEASAKKLVSTAASTAVDLTIGDSTTTQITKAFTQNPQSMLTHVQHLSNDGQLKSLLEKPSFQAQLDAGNVELLTRNKDFQHLMKNEDMRAIMANTEDQTTTNAFAEKAAAEKMIAAWQKMGELKTNPRVIEIINDNTFQQQLNSANKLPLMMNPQLRELTEIIFSDGKHQVATTSVNAPKQKSPRYEVEDITNGMPRHSQTQSSAANAQGEEKKIYRWTDANGDVHYSDMPVKN